MKAGSLVSHWVPFPSPSRPFLQLVLRDGFRGPCRLACGHMSFVSVSHVNIIDNPSPYFL